MWSDTGQLECVSPARFVSLQRTAGAGGVGVAGGGGAGRAGGGRGAGRAGGGRGTGGRGGGRGTGGGAGDGGGGAVVVDEVCSFPNLFVGGRDIRRKCSFLWRIIPVCYSQGKLYFCIRHIAALHIIPNNHVG